LVCNTSSIFSATLEFLNCVPFTGLVGRLQHELNLPELLTFCKDSWANENFFPHFAIAPIFKIGLNKRPSRSHTHFCYDILIAACGLGRCETLDLGFQCRGHEGSSPSHL